MLKVKEYANFDEFEKDAHKQDVDLVAIVNKPNGMVCADFSESEREAAGRLVPHGSQLDGRPGRSRYRADEPEDVPPVAESSATSARPSERGSILMENDATKTILPSKEALNEFLKAHKYKSFPTAVEAARNGKKLVFIFLDWEAYGDRSYYYCKEDDTVYSDYLSIGD